jgi:hypothetical protein
MIRITPDTQKVSRRALACKALSHIRREPITTNKHRIFQRFIQAIAYCAGCSPTFNTSAAMLSATFIYFAADCEINMRLGMKYARTL